MRRLSSVILLLALSVSLIAQKSPHGDSFKANCDDCHKTDGWKVDLRTVSFDHDGTKFPLVGQHQAVNCKQCHTSLEFAKAPVECNACHTDMHAQTVGNECARCHTPNSWVVTNITQLHQQSRFPLLGAHTLADCRDCHRNLIPSTPSAPTASLLRFDPLGIECIDCHRANFIATTSPNHVANNYSTNCTDCHALNSLTWAGAGINHNFFSLEGGHANVDCIRCHTSGSFSKIPSECISCHQPDYTSAANPSHTALNFSTVCSECHTLNPGWRPAEYRDHDTKSFPTYSGKHNGQWASCADCHTNPSNYTQFTCINCHEHNKGDTDNKHDGVSGYSFNSEACFSCHPTGSAEGSFDHSKSGFPLTGAHITTACADCHTNGYAGTSNVCASCHTNNYNQTTNPNHKIANGKFTEDCIACHTTVPGWKPATYPTHSNLNGAHIPIANACADCHKGSYTNIPQTCFDCHATNYTQSNNPSHSVAQFPTTCADCHSQTAWTPSTFNHDGQYFPIYSGKHQGEWTNCSECHPSPSDYAQYTCTSTCHLQPNMDNEHQGVGGYQYINSACLGCHPTGNSEGAFNHSSSPFPLTGGHIGADCASCHTNGYGGTSGVCSSCHTPNYNQTTNPNHTAIGISNDCASCHTTNPGWNPATFATHNNYYVLAGAHVPIANDCASCHQGNYVNSPNTCFGCHAAAYNQTTNPNHVTSQFATTCETCHSQTAWIPSTFDHNNTYPLTGAHATIANNCIQCHANGYANTPNTCAGCHQNDYNQSTNPNHSALSIPNDCATCHTTNPGWAPATFPIHNNYYVLAGTHTTLACVDCHNGNYTNTPNTCSGCHINDYNQTNDPNHAAAQFPTTCADCHTQTAWTPSTFNHDGQYFPIYSGKHNGEWNTCSDCHPNASDFSVYTCTTSCHPQNSTNNDHDGVSGYQYLSSACLNCHPNGSEDGKMRDQRILNKSN